MFDVKDKRVVFITTKNLDYLRNVQEINLLKESAKSVEIIGYKDKSYIKRLIKIYFKILFKSFKKDDCVFVGFAPQLILPFFKFKFKKKCIIIDFFISVYDTLVFDRKKFKEGSLLARLCKWLDKKCIRSAKQVICDTNAHGDYFASEFDYKRENIQTLYLEADKSIYTDAVLEKPDNIKDKFTVLYFGSVLPLQGVEIVLGAMKELADRKDMHFYFVGPVTNKELLPKSDNFEHFEWLKQEELAKYIAYSDLCLAGHFNANIAKARRTIPGKAYIYEAMNKPMILGENSATRELFTDDDKHFFVEMGSIDKLVQKIVDLAK